MRRLFEGGVYLRAASISGNTEYIAPSLRYMKFVLRIMIINPRARMRSEGLL